MKLRLFLFSLCVTTTVFAAPPPGSAHHLFETKNYPEAREAFEKIVAAEPQNADAHFHLGVLAERRGDHDAAVRHLEQATLFAPLNSNYFLELGGAYGTAAQKAGLMSKLGWARKALGALEKAVQLDPDNLSARNGLLSYYREAPSIAGGGIQKAYAEAEEIRKRDPLLGAAVLGQLYLSDKKPEQAFALYDEALTTAPDHYGLLYGVGRAAAQTGLHLDRGEKALRRCLELTPGPDDPGHAPVHWRLGHLAEKRHDPAAARVAYQAALQLEPQFKPAIDSLAKLH